MNKFIQIIHRYLIIGLPFVIGCILWQTIQPEIADKQSSHFSQILWNVLGINLMLWFAILALLLLLLIIVPQVREKTLRWIANIKERDEREEYITGKAARAAYISTLSLIIFFFAVSVVSLNIERIGSESKKHLAVSISIDIGKKPETTSTNNELLFQSRNLSLPTSTILFILLCWQLLVFNFAARKEQKK